MRKGTVVNLKGYKVYEFIKNNNVLIIIVSFLLVGMIVGNFTVSKFSSLSEYASSYIDDYISSRTDVAYLKVVSASFTSSIMILIVIFASGASMLGVIIVPLIAAFKGFLYGCVSSYLYSHFSIKGIAFNAIMIIPPAAVFIISLLLASRESIKFSVIIARLTLPKATPKNLYIDFKNYCGRYLIIMIIVLISALLDAVLSCSFINFFKI